VCVGLVNCDSYDLAGDIVEATVQALKANLRECKWEHARNLIRFCADLANSRVITNGSLISLFENLVDVTAEDNIPQVRSDFYVYAVLSALPLVGKELAEKDDLDQLLNTVEEYISKRSKAHVAGLKVWQSDTPHAQEEYLDCLWAQISKLRNDKWIEYQIPRIQHMFPQLASATQHTLPDFLPPPHEPHFVYPFPRVVFRLFDYTDCPDASAPLPGAHSIERFLAEESIRNIMNLMFYNRKDWLVHLIRLSVCSHPQ
jgi:nuclear cap-binding protein subunit 1